MYEPDPAGPESADPAAAPHANRPPDDRTRWNTPVGHGAQLEPATRAGNTAARAVSRMVARVEQYQKEIEAAENNAYGENVEAANREIDDAFSANANVGIEAVEVTTRLTEPAKTDGADDRPRPVHEAVIHLKATDAVRIHCRRNGTRLQVSEVVATESGHTSRIRPDAATAAQLDTYATAILQDWGL